MDLISYKEKIMKRTMVSTCLMILGWLSLAVHGDALTGRFTYQGRLFDQESPAGGSYDLKFTLFDSADPASAVMISNEQISEDIPITDGYFTASLDFGSFAFNGQQRWLRIAIRPGDNIDPNAFQPLSPLQELTPVPYALYSSLAGTALNAQTLNGLPSGEFAQAAHLHAAEQITSGTLNTDLFSALADLIAEGLLNNNADDIARNNGILQRTLNADLLDGKDASDFADSRHAHAFSDITGAIDDSQVPDTITIEYAASAGTALNAKNADSLDGMDSKAFALDTHEHSAAQITSGALNNARFSAYGNLMAEGYLGNTSGSIAQNNTTIQKDLNADMLDGYHAGSFMMASQDYGRSGVTSTLYEGASTLTSLYVNEGQANAINSAMIINGAVTSVDLADEAVTTGKIAAQAVRDEQILFPLDYFGADANGGLISMVNSSDGSFGNYPAGLYGGSIGTPGSYRTMGVLGAAPSMGQSGSQIHSLPTGKIGVAGASDTGYGVAGYSYSLDGLYGESHSNNGVYGESASNTSADAGVKGVSTSSASGVYGTSASGYGLYGYSNTSYGAYIYSNSSYGLRCYSASSHALYASNNTSSSHAGNFTSSTGTGLNGATLYAKADHTGGVALWAINNNAGSTDTTAVFSNLGTGYLIKGFGGDGGEHEFAVYNDGKVWAKGGVEVPSGARVITPTLQITGGSDLSENFDIRHPDGQSNILPGMVVCIDPQRPGKLIVSNQAHDHKVAGIISGAGGIQPGMMMGQRNTLADGSNPVALSGRVYCLVDTSNGPVEPGDLLTTSATPGHAMKVTDHSQAAGAILGKAMTSLTEGKGLVLVLVSLQ